METNIQIKMVDISLCQFNTGQVPGLPANPRTREDEKQEILVESIKSLPEMSIARSLLVYKHNDKFVVIGGNRRLEAFQKIGQKDVPVIELPQDLSIEKLRRITIIDNEYTGKTDWEIIKNEWDVDELEDWGVDIPDFEEESKSLSSDKKDKVVKLADKFLVPHFSILDTRKGEWQNRKREWKDILGVSGETRECTLTKSLEIMFPSLYTKSTNKRKELGISFKEYIENYVSAEELQKHKKSVYSSGTSLFDPVLAEILCLWFTPEKGKIFDCFAGDTRKGAVFSILGFNFCGIELRKDQYEDNIENIKRLGLNNINYINDDGQNVDKYFEKESQDLLFSCPPYFDLEVYSDLENDASNQKNYEDFVKILDNAFSKAIQCLKQNRFAVVVVGDIRSKINGGYYDFCGSIKNIFKNAGMILYNEMIVVESIGTAAIRAAKNMESRKVTKTHQNVLVFYKGDTKQIKSEFKKLNFDDLKIVEENEEA